VETKGVKLSQKVEERGFGGKENGQSDSKLSRFGEHVNLRRIVIEEIEFVKGKLFKRTGLS